MRAREGRPAGYKRARLRQRCRAGERGQFGVAGAGPRTTNSTVRETHGHLGSPSTRGHPPGIGCGAAQRSAKPTEDCGCLFETRSSGRQLAFETFDAARPSGWSARRIRRTVAPGAYEVLLHGAGPRTAPGTRCPGDLRCAAIFFLGRTWPPTGPRGRAEARRSRRRHSALEPAAARTSPAATKLPRGWRRSTIKREMPAARLSEQGRVPASHGHGREALEAGDRARESWGEPGRRSLSAASRSGRRVVAPITRLWSPALDPHPPGGGASVTFGKRRPT